ncbi:MAG: TraB/GumN family protein [Acidobacteriota bacterium]|nr:TraB/GumN family protein [Acidobacteriota bacterium]MDE2964917.1 TraB/GumN family protein [Acidobacteriota bacterium]
MSFSQWNRGPRPKKAVLALLAIVLSLILGADGVAAQESPATTETSRGCLWEVSSEKGTLFLLGTVHLLKPGTHVVSPAAKAAFEQAQTILLELDLDEAESPASRQLFARKALLQGETLKDKVSSETLALAVEKTEALGLPFDRLSNLKPWSLSLSLTLFKLQALGFDPRHGVDRYYFDQGKQAGKEIGALETMEFQLDLFDGMSDRLQEEFLRQTLADLDLLEEETEQLVQAWSQGEVKVLEELMEKSFEDYPGLYQRLVVERNKNWVLRIEPLLNRPGTTLVVVGALHLVGTESVVELLKKQGYTVRQL